jgi:hypothetical protein
MGTSDRRLRVTSGEGRVPVSFGSSCLIGLPITGVPIPWQQLIEPCAGYSAMRASTSASQANGSTSLSFAVMISVAMMAAHRRRALSRQRATICVRVQIRAGRVQPRCS